LCPTAVKMIKCKEGLRNSQLIEESQDTCCLMKHDILAGIQKHRGVCLKTNMISIKHISSVMICWSGKCATVTLLNVRSLGTLYYLCSVSVIYKLF
jgi:hypothetical protein